jgi:signal transduction histidine kinase
VSIATRVTLLTVLLVIMTLGLYGLFSLRTRKAELSSSHEQSTQLFASALAVSLQAALQDGLFEDLPGLIRRLQGAERDTEVVYLDLIQPQESAAFPAPGTGPPAPTPSTDATARQAARSEPTRAERLRRVEITGQPYGEHIVVSGRPVYAYMFPLRGSQHRIVAAVDILRPESEVERAYDRAVRDAILTLGSLSLLLVLFVSLTVRQEMTRPLLRLVTGVDEVTRGDYTGAILRERNDEVGLLADRFNEMTRSLRQAREEILAGVDAKLQLEQRLRHSDKLATIGQLAAGIAHEVGTPLNVIGGRARVMARRADDPQAVAKNAEIIATQAERITKIIQQLLDYARRKAPARGPVDLRAVCASTLDFLEHQLQTRGVAAALQPFWPPPDAQPPDSTAPHEPSGDASSQPPQLPVVLGDADQLQQVCLNLCMNAIQAMPEGGRLQLQLQGLVRKRPGLDRASPGAYVMLAVEDTGVGIDQEHIGRIFEPFYSTKNADSDPDRSGGSGLGLSVSAGIVKDHDGWIECERRPPGLGGGTIFRVYLPALETESHEAASGHETSSGTPKNPAKATAKGAI